MEYHGTQFSLTCLQDEDAVSLHKMMRDNASRFASFLPKTLAQNRTLQQSKAYISNKRSEWQQGLSFTFALKSQHGDIAGLIILKNLLLEKHQAEFAYCISEKFGRKGWISQAVGEAVALAEMTLKIENFQIIAHCDNYASVKVAKNNGFCWTKTLVNAFYTLDGQPIDMELYELQLPKKRSNLG